jgi:hypothetical protein
LYTASTLVDEWNAKDSAYKLWFMGVFKLLLVYLFFRRLLLGRLFVSPTFGFTESFALRRFKEVYCSLHRFWC